MTGAQLNTLINYKCRSTDTSFSLAEKLVLVNIFKDEIAGKIQERRPEIWNTTLSENLVANQRIYPFAAGTLGRIVSVELDLDNDGDFELATAVQRLQFRDALDEASIAAAYSGNPSYFIRHNGLYLLTGTIASVTNGLRTVRDTFPADLANLTGSTELSADPTATTHGFPRQFHELWARRVSIAYKSRNKITLDPEDLLYEKDLEKELDNMAIAVIDEALTGKLPASQDDNGYDN